MAAMTGPYHETSVRLHRDSLNTAWGFRLQGGKDFKAQLTIQRVFVGSPAEGEVHRGDIILAIDNHDTSNLTHKQAQDIIKNAGGSVSLRLNRGTVAASTPYLPPQPAAVPQGFRSRPSAVGPGSQPGSRPTSVGTYGFVPKPQPHRLPHKPSMEFGTDYSRGYQPQNPPTMLNMVQQSLDNVIWQNRGPEDDEPYQQIPLNALKAKFNAPPPREPQIRRHRQIQRQQEPQTPPWVRDEFGSLVNPSSVQQPGIWANPKVQSSSQNYSPAAWSPGSPTRPQPAPVYRPQPSHQNYQPPQQQEFAQQYQPAQHQQPAQQYQPAQHQQHAPQHFQPAQHRHQPMQYYRPPAQSEVVTDEPPAWMGTLRDSGTGKVQDVGAAPRRGPAAPVPTGPVVVHDPKVQNVHFAPGESPHYQQLDPSEAESDSARVVHLQYNSPLGLYSKDNVVETLDTQTAGKPGAGTMQVVGGGNPAQQQQFGVSPTSRMVQQEDKRRGGPGSGPAGGRATRTRPQAVPQHSDPRLQHDLKHAYHTMDEHAREDDFGVSDF